MTETVVTGLKQANQSHTLVNTSKPLTPALTEATVLRVILGLELTFQMVLVRVWVKNMQSFGSW